MSAPKSRIKPYDRPSTARAQPSNLEIILQITTSAGSGSRGATGWAVVSCRALICICIFHANAVAANHRKSSLIGHSAPNLAEQLLAVPHLFRRRPSVADAQGPEQQMANCHEPPWTVFSMFPSWVELTWHPRASTLPHEDPPDIATSASQHTSTKLWPVYATLERGIPAKLQAQGSCLPIQVLYVRPAPLGTSTRRTPQPEQAWLR